MSHDIPFEEDAMCQSCGVKGAYDFMGDLACLKCASLESDIDKKVLKNTKWISVKDRLPEVDQQVDIWFIDSPQNRGNNNTLKGTQYYHDWLEVGCRKTNFYFKKGKDDEGVLNIFHNGLDGRLYKEYIIENEEISHWMSLPEPPIDIND